MRKNKTQPDPLAAGHGTNNTLSTYSSASNIEKDAAIRKIRKKVVASLGQSGGGPTTIVPAREDSQSPAGMELVQVIQGMIGGAQCLVVDGRALHSILGVKRDFATWFKSKVQDYDLVEKIDFEKVPETGGNSKVGRPTQDYSLSLGIAKELAMVERTEQGRAARRYFIECEQRLLKAGLAAPVLAQPASSPVGHSQNSMLNYYSPGEVEEITAIHRAMHTRTWVLALRQANRVLLLGRDEDIAENFAFTYQIRLMSQLVKAFDDRDITAEYEKNYLSNTVEFVSNWTPSDH